MWALLIALSISGSLVAFAWGQKEEPTVRPAWRKAKLVRLAAKLKTGKLTLDQAEDGSVLAREFAAPGLEKEFKKIAESMKRRT